MKLLRKILFPLNPVYFLFVWLRNKAYDWGLFRSKSYDFPVICVGNLSMGGTGKTPMVEYLIRLLESTKTVAVLSRGYGRKSQGFVLADSNSNNNTLGDEPFQIKSKFPGVIVAVDNNRQHGIACLQALDYPPKIILLDDAFQHRSVQAGFSVLLTTYNDLYCDDMVLPAGNLREPRSGAQRAQIVVVTKCPNNLTNAEKKVIQRRIKLNSNQQLFFSSIVYDDFIYSDQEKESIQMLKNKNFTLVTGIANATPMVDYLKHLGLKFEHLSFPDHHTFSKKELELIALKPLVLTTEKDASRLQSLAHKDLYFLPITLELDASEKFETALQNFIKKLN
ncbi:MAG: tetraacyldisaccharide 4'-kinase [Flavobacteriaceae bacterium]|nr:tetraacyldisaccharide 4'-kinase [Flavobacteriaceae bacterium]